MREGRKTMSAPVAVRKLLSPLIDRKVELGAPAYDVDRRRVLSRIKEARSSERRERRRKLVGSWAAAAAVLLVAGGWLSLQRGGRSDAALEVVVSEGSATRMNAGNQAAIVEKGQTRIAASGELETATDSKASVRAADGLEIELGGQTHVVLDRMQLKSRELKLVTGSIRCAVPHQVHSEPFQVLTPDVTITDLGTVFTVTVDPTHATLVTVQEGEVMVRHAAGQSRVRAPGSWSSTVAMTVHAQTPAGT